MGGDKHPKVEMVAVMVMLIIMAWTLHGGKAWSLKKRTYMKKGKPKPIKIEPIEYPGVAHSYAIPD